MPTELPVPSDTRLGKTRPAAEHVSYNATVSQRQQRKRRSDTREDEARSRAYWHNGTVSQRQLRNDGVISASFPLT